MINYIEIGHLVNLLTSVQNGQTNKEIVNIMHTCDCVYLISGVNDMLGNRDCDLKLSDKEMELLMNFISNTLRYNLNSNKCLYKNSEMLYQMIQQVYKMCIHVKNDISLGGLMRIFTLILNNFAKASSDIQYISIINQLLTEIHSLINIDMKIVLYIIKAIVKTRNVNETNLSMMFSILNEIYEKGVLYQSGVCVEIYFDVLIIIIKKYSHIDICVNKYKEFHDMIISLFANKEIANQYTSLEIKIHIFQLLFTIITTLHLIPHKEKYIMLISTEISNIKISLNNNKTQLINAISDSHTKQYTYLYFFIKLLSVLTPSLSLTAQEIISLSIELIVPLLDILISSSNNNKDITHYYYFNSICNSYTSSKESKYDLIMTLCSFLKEGLSLYGCYLHQTLCYYINTLVSNENVYMFLLCLVKNIIMSSPSTNEIVFPLLCDKVSEWINRNKENKDEMFLWMLIENYFDYLYLQLKKEIFDKLLLFIIGNVNQCSNKYAVISLTNITKNLFANKRKNVLDNSELSKEITKFYNKHINSIINTFFSIDNESLMTIYYSLISKLLKKNILGNHISNITHFIIKQINTFSNKQIVNKHSNHLIYAMFNLLKQIISKYPDIFNNDDHIETEIFDNICTQLQYANCISYEDEIIDIMIVFMQQRKKIVNAFYIGKLLPHINQVIRKDNELNSKVFKFLISIIQYTSHEQKVIMFNKHNINFLYKLYQRSLNNETISKETFMIKSILIKIITTYNEIEDNAINTILNSTIDNILQTLTLFNNTNNNYLMFSSFNIDLYKRITNILYDLCLISYAFFSYSQDIMNAINRNNMFYDFIKKVDVFIGNIREYKWINVCLGKMIVIGMSNVVNNDYYMNDSWMVFKLVYEMMAIIHKVRVNERKEKEGRSGLVKSNKVDDEDEGNLNVNEDMKIIKEVNDIIIFANYNDDIIDEYEFFKLCADILKQKYPNEYNNMFIANIQSDIEQYNNILHTKKVKITLNSFDINNEQTICLPRRIVTFKKTEQMKIDSS